MSKKISFLILFTLLFTSWVGVKAEEVKPDLSISSLSISEPSSSNISFDFCVVNNGSETVQRSGLSFYNNTTSKILSGFIQEYGVTSEYNQSVPLLDNGEEWCGSYWIIKGNAVFNGVIIDDNNNEIKISIDSDNDISETNENNNDLTKELAIGEVNNVTNVEIGNITKTSATVTWDTSLNSNSSVEYYNSDRSIENELSDLIFTQKSHSFIIDLLNPGEKYYFIVKSKTTESGEYVKSDKFSFTTKSEDVAPLSVTNIEVSSVTSEVFTIEWQTNGNYDCTMIYSTKDGNLDDDFLVSTRDADDYIFGSNFPKSNSNGTYNYAIEVKNQGDDTKYFNGSKGYYNLICYDESRNKVTSSVYSFNIPSSNGTDNSDDNGGKDNDDSGDDNSNTNQLVLQLQRQISALEKQVINLEKKLTQLDQKFAERYAGTMFLDVENHGRLWYVDPASKNRFYFENGISALSIGSKLATGITYEDIQKIPVGVPDKLYNLTDSDGDGLPDRLESALGSDPNKNDTDDDGFSDKEELKNGYSPVNNNKYIYNQSLIDRLEGKMLLQVSGPNSHGEIWYIKDGQRWYGGTEDSMYEIMKARSLGATPENIRKISVGEVEGIE